MQKANPSKWCDWCLKHGHTLAECWCTRPIDFAPAVPISDPPMQGKVPYAKNSFSDLIESVKKSARVAGLVDGG